MCRDMQGRTDRCGDRRVKCEDGCGFGGCVTAGFSLPKGCYATILRSRVCAGVMCRGLRFSMGYHEPAGLKSGASVPMLKVLVFYRFT